MSLTNSERKYTELSMSDYRQVFNDYFVTIRNFIYFKCGNEQLAEDLAQDTFVKLWENRAKIDRSTVKSYLYTIGSNLTINYLKRQQLKYKFVNQAERRVNKDDPEYLLQMKDYEIELQEVIESIPEGSREVFLMNRLEDLKYKEIGERLGISVKAVEKRMSKALKIIREKLNVDI